MLLVVGVLSNVSVAVAAPPHSHLVADSQGWKSKYARFARTGNRSKTSTDLADLLF